MERIYMASTHDQGDLTAAGGRISMCTGQYRVCICEA